MASLSKTNYILFRECPKNAWIKIHKPELYFSSELTAFERSIIETGNEVDLLARGLFPASPAGGPTAEFQNKFEKDGYIAITDILKEDNEGVDIYEVKATNEVDKKTHLYDLAFQAIVLEKCGLRVKRANIIHLNKDYRRKGKLDLVKLFTIKDLTDEVRKVYPEVEADMEKAKAYLSSETEPAGPCCCLYKGRSSHCTTFRYSNPHVPEYGVHDISRIGLSKRKLTELVDSDIFALDKLPEGLELNDTQKNQILTFIHDRIISDPQGIKEKLSELVFPLHFLDYETFPAAIPRFDNYAPYQQIPFQYSLHILSSPEEEPEHLDFLYASEEDPSREFVSSLRSHVGDKGSVIVWHKDFECGRNKELCQLVPEAQAFFDDMDKRIFDLEEVFKKQLYVHKDFRGSSSIKKVLPVLAPELSYADLVVKEGGSAADTWNKIVMGEIEKDSRDEAINNLREYCKRDTYAMYAIWRELDKMCKA